MKTARKNTRMPTAAQIARTKKELAALDAKITKANIANHAKLAFAIVGAVKLDPRIEFEIVLNYLNRRGYVMIPKEEASA